jgi:hypothetical protein
MYARGYAYFDRMLPRLGPITNGKTHGQKASYFCLENQHWRIIALDTGYDSIGWPLLNMCFNRPARSAPNRLIGFAPLCGRATMIHAESLS